VDVFSHELLINSSSELLRSYMVAIWGQQGSGGYSTRNRTEERVWNPGNVESRNQILNGRVNSFGPNSRDSFSESLHSVPCPVNSLPDVRWVDRELD
jgi:hypothetical protein